MFSGDGRAFSITRTEQGWAWSAAQAGRAPESGIAPSRNAAAACVIRTLARSVLAAPDGEPARRAA